MLFCFELTAFLSIHANLISTYLSRRSATLLLDLMTTTGVLVHGAELAATHPQHSGFARKVTASTIGTVLDVARYRLNHVHPRRDHPIQQI